MTNVFNLWVYPGANPNSEPSLWEPYATDVTTYVRRPGTDGGQPINYSGGRQDESADTDAGQMTLTLDNRDGRFSTEKIDGPYYGLIDTNTPIRLMAQAVKDTFTRTVASSSWGTSDTGHTYSVSGTGTWSVNGSRGEVIIAAANTAPIAIVTNGNTLDVDMVTTFTPLAAATGTAYCAGHIVRRTDNLNLVYARLDFATGLQTSVRIFTVIAGVTTTLATNALLPTAYSVGAPWKMRTQADGNTIRTKVWLASTAEPTTWTLTATDSANAGSSIAIYTARLAANTNSGVVALLGVDDFYVNSIEWTGYVVSWPMAWDMTGRNSWASITAAGILRRLRQGTNPIRSPLRRQLRSTADVTGYWPMEDGAEATYFLPDVPSLPNTMAATFTGLAPSSDSTLAGSAAVPSVSGATGLIQATPGKGNGGTGFAVMVLMKLGSIPAGKTRMLRIRTSRGPVPIWDFSIDATGTILDGIAADGTVLFTNSAVFAEDWTKWTAWQLETDNTLSPGNTSYSMIYHSVGKATYWAQTGTVAGALNSIVSYVQLALTPSSSVAHLWTGYNTLPFVTDTFSKVSSGYVGELATDRFIRVCGEAGIPASIKGSSSLGSEPMGIQRESSTLAVLQACVQTDAGIMAERGGGLEMIPRAARWNLAATMSLSVAAGEVAAVPAPVRDDQRLRNQWTISSPAGGSATYIDDASTARNGILDDSAQINPKTDSVLQAHAAWRTYLGTAVRARWPSIAINMVRNPQLRTAWRTKDYGWRLLVTTALGQITGNEPDLVVEGFQASLDPDNWTAELVCADGRAFVAAVADDTGIYGRVDSEYCTVKTAITSSGTSLAVTTTTGFLKWDITAGLWSGGVDLNVGGERVTVNAVVNNAGQDQTFTITARGVNGYAAAHAIGTKVSLWFPATAAL